ncbi:hypothetical protein H4R35_000185 [Dimargaris xerosporica]|nr:hypothetical protein H4R35_000185 [Dimargaris xerosporica]
MTNHAEPSGDAASRPTLGQILDHANDQEPSFALPSQAASEDESARDSDTNGTPATTRDQYCVECRDQGATVFCEQCQEQFCDVCCAMIHRTGNRKRHTRVPLAGAETQLSTGQTEPIPSANGLPTSDSVTDGPVTDADLHAQGSNPSLDGGDRGFGQWITERAKYIPMRLTLTERKYLRLLEAALNVSEYTDRVDILSYGSKSRRIVAQIKDICAILSGLLLASDYRAGQRLFEDRNFAQNGEFFQTIFEIGRRHKVMNPEKMRQGYGKLMYLLQDSMLPEVQDLLQFSCVKPITTVHSYLADHDALPLLMDPLVALATKEIIAEGKPLAAVQAESKQKHRAVEMLCRKYANASLESEQIRQCLYSIGDNHNYLRMNRDPCDQMLEYLTTYFSPTDIGAPELSLTIAMGKEGARLTHDHKTQFQYVKQTLSLWREIAHEMFMLWSLADADLLASRNPYRLRDTGQGLNRVQACPRVSRAVHTILHRAQQATGYWIGSSVVHLGDHNVPNALMFIDKYNQVASILNPVVACLAYLDTLPTALGVQEGAPDSKMSLDSGASTEGIPRLSASNNSSTGSFFSTLSSNISSTFSSLASFPDALATKRLPLHQQPHYRQQAKGLYQYIQATYGDVITCKRVILADFFRHGFDGSGADNFFDAGSCIDGRLTSAWNWCSQIDKKPYYPVFLLSGFVGFNGEGY